MVRGHPGCSELCNWCQNDCVCTQCRRCHRCKPQPNSRACNDSHKCKTYDQLLESRNEDIRELKSELEHLEQKVEDLESKCSKMECQRYTLNAIIADLSMKNTELESFRLQANADRLVARRFAERFSSDSVVILVGPKQQRFTCNTDPLRAASLYFREILLQDTSQEELQPIILSTTVYDVKAFGMFIEYCYFGCYLDSEDSEDDGGLTVHAQVYVLAEKLKCDGLKKLALKKATSWCCGYGLRTNIEDLNGLFPPILYAIDLIYTYTDDPHTGALPAIMANSKDMNRDGFRLLLAHLAATYLTKLRSHKSFLEIHHAFPEFGTDVLLFIKESSQIGLNDESKDLYTPEYLHITRNKILTLNSLVKMETLKVVVGEGIQFNIHTAAIECSGYFQRLLSSEMKEAQEKMVVMDSEVDDPEAFEVFSQYCYFGDYLTEVNGVAAIVLHAKVYALAEKLDSPHLKEIAFHKAAALVGASHYEQPKDISSIVSQSISIVYENTYDSRYEKLFKLPDDNEKVVTIKLPVRGKKKKKKGNTNSSQTIQIDMRSEKFRYLLASFASAHVETLRKHADFVSVYHCYPDFATDVMMLAGCGEDIEVNPDGQLKLVTDLSSILSPTSRSLPPSPEERLLESKLVPEKLLPEPESVPEEPESVPEEPAADTEIIEVTVEE